MSSESNQSRRAPASEVEATTAVDLDWLTLDADEEVLWASTPHKSSLIPAFVVGIPLSLVLVGIPILASAYLTYKNTNFVVTTRGLYRKRGIFSRDVKQIGFDKVQNISYTQSAIGSSLGYGTVEISTAGSSGVELRFQSIPTPAKVQELISREIDRREDTGRDEEDDVDDVLDQILTELRGIRQALDTDQQTAVDTERVAESAPDPKKANTKTINETVDETTDETVNEITDETSVDSLGWVDETDEPNESDESNKNNKSNERNEPDNPFEPAIAKPVDDSDNE